MTADRTRDPWIFSLTRSVWILRKTRLDAAGYDRGSNAGPLDLQSNAFCLDRKTRLDAGYDPSTQPSKSGGREDRNPWDGGFANGG